MSIFRGRMKLILVPALILLLAAVAWPRTEGPIGAAIKKQRLPETSSAAQPTSLGMTGVPWEVDVAAMVDRNPFAVPAFLEKRMPESLPPTSVQSTSSTERLRVDAVLTTNGTITAIVNGRPIRLGDQVDERRRVLSISHDTITIGAADE